MLEIKPDLIILELNMPGLSGSEVLNHIKADPNTPRHDDSKLQLELSRAAMAERSAE